MAMPATDDDGLPWITRIGDAIRAGKFENMGATYSPGGEYVASNDVVVPFRSMVTAMPDSAPAAQPQPATLAARIVAAAEKRGARIDREPGQVNIVYIEGINADGTANANRNNAFDDLRCVIRFDGGEPQIAGAWEATTQPGTLYTQHPVADAVALGAAIIALGQQRAWQVGLHRGDHEALIQTGGEVTVYRDGNKDYRRDGDRTTTGWYGINQHWGYDQPKDDIGGASAGCLVGRSKAGHREFMAIVKSDPRYLADHQFVFAATVLTAVEIGATTMPDSPSASSGYRSLIGGYFSDTSGGEPASIRYNNPGAVNSVAWVQAFPGYAGVKVIGGGNPIAIFYTPEQGCALYWTLLQKYAASGVTSLQGIVNRYGGGQDYSAYVAYVCNKSGLAASAEIDLNNDAVLLPFAKAMFQYEAGKPTPLTDAQIKYGFDLVRGGMKAPAPVTPAPTPAPTLPSTSDPASLAIMARIDALTAEIRAQADRLTALEQKPMADTPATTATAPTRAQPDIGASLARIEQLLANRPSTTSSVYQTLASAMKMLPGIGAYGSIIAYVVLWIAQSFHVVGTAGIIDTAAATPTGSTLSAGILGTLAASLLRIFTKPKTS